MGYCPGRTVEYDAIGGLTLPVSYNRNEKKHAIQLVQSLCTVILKLGQTQLVYRPHDCQLIFWVPSCTATNHVTYPLKSSDLSKTYWAQKTMTYWDQELSVQNKNQCTFFSCLYFDYLNSIIFSINFLLFSVAFYYGK